MKFGIFRNDVWKEESTIPHYELSRDLNEETVCFWINFPRLEYFDFNFRLCSTEQRGKSAYIING